VVRTVTRSACRAPEACALPQEGGGEAVDKAAERHTKKTGHTTAVVTEPVR
jgi:hypothetical protein